MTDRQPAGHRPPTTEDLAAIEARPLAPLAAVIETAIQSAPVRLGTDDWGTVLGARLLADVAAYMGRLLGPDARVLGEVQAERDRQDARWGEQNHPDGTAEDAAESIANTARRECDEAFAAGRGTWAHILTEEVTEALAEDDPVRLRAELVQVAAVAVNWIGAIDRRTAVGGSVAVDEDTQ